MNALRVQTLSDSIRETYGGGRGVEVELRELKDARSGAILAALIAQRHKTLLRGYALKLRPGVAHLDVVDASARRRVRRCAST